MPVVCFDILICIFFFGISIIFTLRKTKRLKKKGRPNKKEKKKNIGHKNNRGAFKKWQIDKDVFQDSFSCFCKFGVGLSSWGLLSDVVPHGPSKCRCLKTLTAVVFQRIAHARVNGSVNRGFRLSNKLQWGYGHTTENMR